MNVNLLNRVFESPRLKLLAVIAVSFCAILFLAAFVSSRSDRETISRRVNIAVRAIGHDLLLRAGDSTSLVRPVIEGPNGVFLLQFENEFDFRPDTLVTIVQHYLGKTDLSQYTVTVMKCNKPEIVYGFEINPPNNNLTPCRGRTQPKACYQILIAFTDLGNETISGAYRYGLAATLVSLIAFVGYGIWGRRPTPPVEKGNSIQIGNFLLFTEQRLLKIKDERIELSDKESKLLEIFATQQNQLIERDRLLKEVWEDDGVFTARSLDMFVSKLRKKLKSDPSIQIINVYGKGYRLDVSNNS
ncbi:MAG: winged helix-turn-helix domain-containing protein [Cyclobacteriaceae bacterium]